MTVMKRDTAKTAYTDKFPQSYNGGTPYPAIYKGRGFEQPKFRDLSNLTVIIILPFKKIEFPLFREHKKMKDGPCKLCFERHGRI